MKQQNEAQKKLKPPVKFVNGILDAGLRAGWASVLGLLTEPFTINGLNVHGRGQFGLKNVSSCFL